MNLYGQDMDESVTPMESGLGWTVDMSSERDFIGRQALMTTPPGSDSSVCCCWRRACCAATNWCALTTVKA